MKNADKVFDGLLVMEFQAGNKKALSLLVNRHNQKLCKHSFWYTQDLNTSKDIVQDSWKVIMNKVGSLKEPDSFGSWATKIVIRKSLDFLKKKTRNKQQLQAYYEASKVDGSEFHKEGEINNLLKSIRLLPQNQQIVLRLFYLEEYSLKEISAILDISVGTIKSRLFHAREKLKIILKK